jgi:hypothetical protein
MRRNIRANTPRTASVTPMPTPAFAPVLRPECAVLDVWDDVVGEDDGLARTLAGPVDFALCVVAVLALAVEVG